MQVIIFPNNEGGVSVMSPALELADQIEAVAARDVPAGLPWRIVDNDDLPPYEVRSRWRWTDEGPLGVAEPEPEPVPQVVSRMQARIALHNAGLLTSVEAAVSAADPFVQIAWADAQEFRRNSQTITTLAAALSMSDEQLDDLFRAAALIEA
jgi:hypothetical protein